MREKTNSPENGSSSLKKARFRALCSVVLAMFSLFLAAAGGALFRVALALRGLDMNLLLYYIKSGLVDARLGIFRYSVVWDVAKASIPYMAAAVLLILWLWWRRLENNKQLLVTLRVRIGQRRFQWRIIKPRRRRLLFRRLPAVLSALLFCAGIGTVAWTIQLPQYLMIRGQDSTVYADEYIDPASQNITFPQGKRNLIHIVMESMEATWADQAHGGQWGTDVTPNLTALAEENISFSDMIDLSGANFTSGALVSQTSGIPVTSYSTMMDAWTLGEILAEEGYRQLFMCGSDGDFGQRKPYFSQHQIEVYDLLSARELGKVAPDYEVGWGMEDYILYEHAKDFLTEMAQDDTPFHLTLLTVDTHFVDGLICQNCESLFPTRYENVVHCADNLVSEFVRWIQDQDFYEDTTIVITGDHLYMDHYFFLRRGVEMADRRIYNCIINPAGGLRPSSRERTFTGLDIFPTTLRAMGAEWDGSRLGLGVDLFSAEPTLVEQMGQQALSYQILANTEGY